MFKKTLVIAEAGVNHNGKLSNAYKLIDIASKSGADIVKFQTFSANNLVTKQAPKAKYQIKNTNNKESQFQMLQKLELKKKYHPKLIRYSKKKKLSFFPQLLALKI